VDDGADLCVRPCVILWLQAISLFSAGLLYNSIVVDIEKQVVYWRDSAEEDWLVGQELISQNRVRHGLFFIHLAFEKLLKAHVCRKTQEIAPRIHNLSRLAEIAGFVLTPDQLNVLSELSAFNIEGRYPGSLIPILTIEQAKAILEKTVEPYQWLIKPLQNQ
jgi:HEPN domain-containing protein